MYCTVVNNQTEDSVCVCVYIYIYIFFFPAVKVVPHSIKHSNPDKPDCSSKDPMEIPSGNLKENLDIVYTYSVKFMVSVQSLTNSTE
jgi:hypothetical protein